MSINQVSLFGVGAVFDYYVLDSRRRYRHDCHFHDVVYPKRLAVTLDNVAQLLEAISCVDWHTLSASFESNKAHVVLGLLDTPID